MKSTASKQGKRIMELLLDNANDECRAIDLHHAGSGYKRSGFVASLSRRISDLRDAGNNITCRRETQRDGQVFTFYTLHL